MTLVKGVAACFCLLTAWLSWGAPARLSAAEEKKKEERKVVVVEPELFRKVMRADARPSEEKPLTLDGGMKGYYAADGETVVIAMKLALPPGEEQRFALYRQRPYHWYAKDPGLVKDVTDEMIKPDAGKTTPSPVEKAGLDKCFSYTGRDKKVTLEFEYRKSKDEKPAWVFKVVVGG
jgi:hypothetical protein